MTIFSKHKKILAHNMTDDDWELEFYSNAQDSDNEAELTEGEDYLRYSMIQADGWLAVWANSDEWRFIPATVAKGSQTKITVQYTFTSHFDPPASDGDPQSIFLGVGSVVSGSANRPNGCFGVRMDLEYPISASYKWELFEINNITADRYVVFAIANPESSAHDGVESEVFTPNDNTIPPFVVTIDMYFSKLSGGVRFMRGSILFDGKEVCDGTDLMNDFAISFESGIQPVFGVMKKEGAVEDVSLDIHKLEVFVR